MDPHRPCLTMINLWYDFDLLTQLITLSNLTWNKGESEKFDLDINFPIEALPAIKFLMHNSML